MMAGVAGRIDVHQHLVPSIWGKYLSDHGLDSGGTAIPRWSIRDATAMMEAHGIAAGILSVTSPGVHFGNDAQARTLARAVNEFAAELVKDDPARVGSFASIPLPDVDAALDETAYALDTLGVDGVVLMSNARGRYLGDPDFEPLWAELDLRGAVVFVHPAEPPMPRLPNTPAPVLDYVVDTTRTALNLVINGVMDRYRNVKVILAHGGGFLPYAAHRFSGLASVVPELDRDKDDVLRGLRRFYFDTALTSSPASLPSLLAFAEPGHVLYGSDWPFAPDSLVRDFDRHLATYPPLADNQRWAVDRGNAEALFPRLAPAITRHRSAR